MRYTKLPIIRWLQYEVVLNTLSTDITCRPSLINSIHFHWKHLVLKSRDMGWIIVKSDVVNFKLKWSTFSIHKSNTKGRNAFQVNSMLLVLYATFRSEKELWKRYLQTQSLSLHWLAWSSVVSTIFNFFSQCKLLVLLLCYWKHSRCKYKMAVSNNVRMGLRSRNCNSARCLPSGQIRFGWSIWWQRILFVRTKQPAILFVQCPCQVLEIFISGLF